MKKFLLDTAKVMAVLLVASCAPETPRQVASGYLDALSRLDFRGAALHSYGEAKERWGALGEVSADLSDVEREKFRIRDWHITGETLAGQEATVFFQFDGVKEGSLSLVKISNGWKVQQRQMF